MEHSFESLFVEVSSTKGAIIIVEIYRVPWTNRHDVITNSEIIINKLQNENKETILGTDPNCDYLNIYDT